jgi:hypothetical protein
VAVVGPELLGPREQLARDLGLAHHQVGEHALARLGRGDPRTVGDAAHAALVHDERVAPLGEAEAPGLTRDHAGEHRVVPVHRPAVLGRERVGLVSDDVREPRCAQLPVGPLVAEVLGQRDGAAQAVADARRAGEQRERPGRAVLVSCPQDLAARRLELEHEVDGALDDRPERLEEALVAGEQVVVPHARGDVGDDVGVELLLLDPVGQVVLVPGAVGPLLGDEPVEGALGLGPTPAEVEGHGRLDVVPRIGVAAGEPGDHAVGQLPVGDGIDGGRHLGATEDAGKVRHVHRRSPGAWSRTRRGSCRAGG